MSQDVVTHFFSGHSMYACFGFAKLLSIASDHGLKIIHKPMDLHEVMVASGSSAFEGRSREQLRYKGAQSPTGCRAEPRRLGRGRHSLRLAANRSRPAGSAWGLPLVSWRNDA